MVKPKLFLVFRPVEGLWTSAEGIVLANFLAERGMIIDDRAEFVRMKDYDAHEYIWYRVCGSQKITITIWDLDS